MLYAQLTHSIGLNDVCDALGHHRGAFEHSRGRGWQWTFLCQYIVMQMAEELFRSLLGHLQCPQDQDGHSKGFLDVANHVVDSTTLDRELHGLG